jgi:hypothetical protein
MPSIVTPMGDLSIHAQEGIYVTLTFEDETGTPRDVTTATFTFETPTSRRT